VLVSEDRFHTRQAAVALLKLAKGTSDPDVAANLLRLAADLKDQAGENDSNRVTLPVEKYSRKARVAEALAGATQDQIAKETYLEVAERWRRIAEIAERNQW
jgi:hypothetical protein